MIHKQKNMTNGNRQICLLYVRAYLFFLVGFNYWKNKWDLLEKYQFIPNHLECEEYSSWLGIFSLRHSFWRNIEQIYCKL